jgi:hypothetical protein
MTEKVFVKGELVQMIYEASPWMDTIGIVLEDYPKERDPEYADTLVHVFYTDGKDIWTPFVFLEKVKDDK